MARKEEKKQGRGKEPNTLTKLMLVAKSGGRCQFDGCNKQLFVDEITLGKLNNSNIAHIVAASPDGPRGNEQSFELSNKLENLMLLCQEHHTLIDANPEEYTIEYLKKMKKAQEIRVESMLNGMDYPETEIIMFESPIKNMSDVRIDFLQAVETIRYYGKNPASKYGNLIRIECFEDYNSKEYWKSVEKRLEDCVRMQVQMMYQYNHDVKVDIFALAPIPLIIKLGSLLGDKKNIEIHQKTRIPDTWIWQSQELTNKFETKKMVNSNGKKVALILSLTAEIDNKRVIEVYNADIIYQIKAKRLGVDCIKSEEDLKMFWKEFQNVCDEIKNVEGIDEISVFPAIPVSAAFEVGRKHMLGVHPIMHIFDDNKGFFKTITIGGNTINE